MNRLAKYLPWFLLLASATLFFLPLGSRALWNSGEGRYAEIAREMLELKDWISPHLNYVLFLEKPPLMYWLTAIGMALFGQNEFAARFWCAVFGVLTVGVAYLFGKHWKNEVTGLLAGSCLATSLGFFALTQYLTPDMALTFWMTFALYAASRMLSERPPDRVKRYTDLWAIAVAGAILTKGLAGIVMPMAILVLTLAYARLKGQARKIPWSPAFLLILFLTIPWFVLVSLKNPSFPPFFFFQQHVSRIFNTPPQHAVPFYGFVLVLLGGFLPWTVFLPNVFRSAFAHRGVAMKRDPVKALLVLWSFFVVVVFFLTPSKHAGAVLPVFPALALLLGSAFQEALEEETIPLWIERGVVRLILVFLAGLCLLKLPQAVPLFSHPVAAVAHDQAGTLSLMLGLGVFILVGIWGMRQSLMCLGGIVLVQVMLLSVAAALSMSLDPYLSNKGLARVLALRAQQEDRIIGYAVPYEDLLQTLPFYLHRRIIIQGDAGELELGRSQAPDAADWFLADPGAADAFRDTPMGAWVVTSEDAAKNLRQAGSLKAFDLIAREGPLVLFRKTR